MCTHFLFTGLLLPFVFSFVIACCVSAEHKRSSARKPSLAAQSTKTKIRCKWCLVSKLFIFNLVVIFSPYDLSIPKYLPINYIDLVHFASHRLLWLFATAQRSSFVRSSVRPPNHSFIWRFLSCTLEYRKDISAFCRICDLIRPNAKQFSVQFNWNFYDKSCGKKKERSSVIDE